MKLDHIENAGASLDTLKGLEETVNDLLEDNITLFTDYPSSDKSIKWRADRLADKLLALANAMIVTNKTTQHELQLGLSALLKDGEK